MNTLITLFGGLAGVFVLYALGGLVRNLPLAVRAGLAGLLPLLGYFVLVVGRWPGLDVVAIHISVFLAAALVLLAFTQFRRRNAGRMHWAPKLLTVFFVGLVVINATLLYIATKGLPQPIARWWLGGDKVYSGFSGVVEHGQGAAKGVSSELSQLHRESQLGWQVEFEGLDGAGQTRAPVVRVRDRTGLPVKGVQVEIRLRRPGATVPALVLSLQSVDAGIYRGALTFPAEGRWLVDLRVMQGETLHYHATRELVLP